MGLEVLGFKGIRSTTSWGSTNGGEGGLFQTDSVAALSTPSGGPSSEGAYVRWKEGREREGR